MQTSAKTELALKRDILDTICRLFSVNPATKDTFRNVGGFVCFISVLVALEGSKFICTDFFFLTASPCKILLGFVQDQEVETKLNLVNALFKTMTIALTGHSLNKMFFKQEIGTYSIIRYSVKFNIPTANSGYPSLASGIQLMGILRTQYATHVLDCVMKMATENVSSVRIIQSTCQ